MVLSAFSVVGLVTLLAAGIAVIAAAIRPGTSNMVTAPDAWKQYRFGFATVSLIFLAFDMEMIFMYPWAVVFARLGMVAFLDMLVFIALLSAGIAYAWRMGALSWE